MIELNKKNLKLIKNTKYLPRYNIDDIYPGIIHFGVGNFHRAHQALYVNQIIEKYKTNLGIIGVSLQNETIKNNLLKQDNLYTLCRLSDEEQDFTIISALKEILFAPKEVNRILNFIADENIKVITITVTEKGYKYDPKKNSLLLDADILSDLEDKTTKTLIGFISKGLLKRFNKNKFSLSIISCDNLSNNGNILEKLVIEFLSLYSPKMLNWVKNNVEFPNTMIDRIVPKQSLENIELIKDKLSIIDRSSIITEPFSQWYIESQSNDLKKILNNKNINFVENLKFYEDIKLKILNASHSAIAYSGLLLGYKYVHDVIDDPACYKFVLNFLEREVIPVLNIPDDFDVEKYKITTLNRFKNQYIKDTVIRISMDGSYKIKIRFIDTLMKNLKLNNNVQYIYFIIACWIKFLHGKDEKGNKIEVSDPKKEELFNIIKNSSEENKLERILNFKFTFNLPQNKNKFQLIKHVKKYYLRINQLGVKETLIRIDKSFH